MGERLWIAYDMCLDWNGTICHFFFFSKNRKFSASSSLGWVPSMTFAALYSITFSSIAKTSDRKALGAHVSWWPRLIYSVRGFQLALRAIVMNKWIIIWSDFIGLHICRDWPIAAVIVKATASDDDGDLMISTSQLRIPCSRLRHWKIIANNIVNYRIPQAKLNGCKCSNPSWIP